MYIVSPGDLDEYYVAILHPDQTRECTYVAFILTQESYK